jgi:TonB-linked SusC/RagA family outer membrane protein
MSASVPSRRWMSVAAALAFAIPFALQAQTGSVAGKVTDASTRQPIADVRVVIPGTALETQTNRDGEYRLVNVRPGRITVGVFRLGYKATSDTVRVAANGVTTHNIVMTASLVTLSEVVVTGTAGNQERKAQSAQVASVSAASIVSAAPISSVGELLQSRVTGVAVNSNSGTAGTAKAIRIRGSASINLSNQPLLFIDGIRINEGTTASGQSGQQYDRLNDLNPDEIESMEVVKGPAAATLYGADASAGVIQIITKKGRPGSNRFTQTLRVESGNVDQAWTPPSNYGLCTAALVASTSLNPLCRGQTVGQLISDNPLVRIGAFRNGTDRQIGWNGRGGGQNYGYNVSFGTENTQGTLPNNKFERYNIRTNFNYVPDSRITIDAGLGLSQTKASLPDNDNNVFGWMGGGLLGSPTTRTDAPVIGSQDGFYSNRHYNAINAIERYDLTHRVIASLAANYLPVSWFTNRFTLGMDYAADEQKSFFPKNDSVWYGGLTDGGSSTQNSRGAERYTFDYLGNLRRTFGRTNEWEANLSGGLQVISTRTNVLTAQGIGFVTNANNSIGSAATTIGGGAFTEQKQYGYLGQLQVGYENRAFMQFGVRVDKNSSFGVKSPSFVLPKVGGTWTLSEERFFEPWTKYVNTLRVRASWGTTGRSPNPGDALTTLVAAPYNIAGTTAAGAIPGNPGNANLKPERGIEFEAGFDASFWKDRVTAEVTYFNKTTNDLIIAKPIPPSLGFNTNPLANIGQIVNRGFEVALNVTALRMKNLSWDVRAGVNTLHNELTSLGGVAPFVLGGAGRALVGQQVAVFVSKSIKSIDVASKTVIVNDTLTPVGNLFPTLEWNLSNTFTVFKDFRVTALLDSKRDFSVWNRTDFFRETQLVRSNRRLDPTVLSPYEFLRRYGDVTKSSPFTTVSGKGATVSDVQDAYIQPGDFVRFRELSVSYTVPSRYMSRMGSTVQGATIALAMQNIKLWTNYQGPDPEVVSNPAGVNGQFSREDFLTIPNPKKTVLRVNFTF